jgi:hypothetical protein
MFTLVYNYPIIMRTTFFDNLLTRLDSGGFSSNSKIIHSTSFIPH